MGVRIIGTGSYLPETVIDNDKLHAQFGFDSDWIVRRTGILERRHVRPHEATSDLCHAAAVQALDRAKVRASDVDLLVLATFTPDMSFPATACLVQDRLKMSCAAVEIEAACAGFMYALITGAAYIASGASDVALIIGGDANSRILNPNDLKTYPLFGDGAGAAVLVRGEPDQGLVAFSLGSDGAGGDMLSRPACGSRMPPTPDALARGLHYMIMDGRAVFRWAVNILCDTIKDVLRASELSADEIDLYIPHQANIRIINAAIDVLHIPRSRVFTNLEKYGNTSAGSIPIALDEALADGRLERGQHVVMSGFGAGLSWGTAVMRW